MKRKLVWKREMKKSTHTQSEGQHYRYETIEKILPLLAKQCILTSMNWNEKFGQIFQ